MIIRLSKEYYMASTSLSIDFSNYFIGRYALTGGIVLASVKQNREKGL